MKILVLGYGYIGSVVARDLVETMPSVEVVIAGRSRDRAEKVAAHVQNVVSSLKQIEKERISTVATADS